MSLFYQPAFYDIFGLLVFLVIILIAIWSLRTNKPLVRWMNIFLLIIGILGLIVDGVIVYTTFFL